MQLLDKEILNSMRILYITNGYPSCVDLSFCVFSQRLVNEWVDQGNECTVICPRKLPGEKPIPGKYEEQYTPKGNMVKVYFPSYLCTGLTARWEKDPFRDWSFKNFYSAAVKIIESENLKFDVVYAQFLGISGWCAVKIAEKYHCNCFADAGESRFRFLEDRLLERNFSIKYLNKLTGIVSVSTQNKELLLDNGILDENKIKVFPNGIDDSHFYPRNKETARQKFGFKNKDIIISFVGHYIDRKGPLRVEAACRNLPVKVAYAGKGPEVPTADNTIWTGPIKPEDIPEFLSSSDIFVLPTLNEGCCNAIIEALACGLPVVSSDRLFNIDILDDQCSICVNPESVEEIRFAIQKLLDDSDLRSRMSLAAASKGNSLSLHNRAIGILEWMKTFEEGVQL